MKIKKILITGSSGYIGSCLSWYFSKKYRIYLIDKAKPGKFNKNKNIFFNCNLLQKKKIYAILQDIKPDVVIHLAGQSTVNEKISMKNYYQNNFIATNNLLDAMNKIKVKNIIFASTAAVYKKTNKLLSENSLKKPISKYGKTKLMSENLIINDKKICSIILRFFNVASALTKPLIGELHKPETHLIPRTVSRCFQGKPMTIYGRDFQTKDGTCLRDYIHILDICNAIDKSIFYLSKMKNKNIFNLGCGRAVSNLEVVNNVRNKFAKKNKIRFTKKRKGDNAKLICSIKKAKKILNWSPNNSNIMRIINDEIKWNKYLSENKINR